MVLRRSVSTFGADHVNQHRVAEDSPVVSGLNDVNEDGRIIYSAQATLQLMRYLLGFRDSP